MALFNPRMTCPTCSGTGQIVVLSLTRGKHLASRRCPGCRGKGKLGRR